MKIKGKKSMELPINIIVMLIIGIILFGIGIGLLNKISNSGNDQIDDLNSKIRTDIANLECSGDDYICAPTMKLKNGESQTFQIFLVNRENNKESFSVEILNSDGSIIADQRLSSNSCGSIKIIYPTKEIEIQSGNSASMPILISANKVSKICSFTAVAQVKLNNIVKSKTPIIIRVE